MWSPAIAEQLRARGYDVQAVAERDDLRTGSDFLIFISAQAESRVIVTENVPHFRPLALEVWRGGASHSGIIFTTDHAFPRGDPRTPGRVVTALATLLERDPGFENLEYWLS
jgi:uncharacterized protein DUF5615